MLKYHELLILEPIWDFAIENYLMFIKNFMRTPKITGRDRRRILKRNGRGYSKDY